MITKNVLYETEEKMKKTIEATIREFGAVRTGRASPSLVEGIHVEYYGTPTPLKQLATISTPDARLLVIQPWDISILSEVEKAILKSELGITPMNDGKLIRISIPQLSKERREELVKLVRKMAEDSRISIRTIRRDANEHVKKLQKDSKITEDDSFKTQEDIQKLTDRYVEKIEQILKDKEKEIMEF
ncbi:MAG: ribosome recycling factor [Candidatus Omnitrophica bacterium]|nr:ribosome recycling factor [Candidatus Omnitrophota bacterium]